MASKPPSRCNMGESGDINLEVELGGYSLKPPDCGYAAMGGESGWLFGGISPTKEDKIPRDYAREVSQGDIMETILTPIHRAGWPFIALFAIITIVLFMFSRTIGLLALAMTGWCTYFFRHPHRVTPLGEGLVISPADGVITRIEKAHPPQELAWTHHPLSRISIFLNVFDVHVNRIPADGIITQISYHPGKFFNASLDKASDLNERNSLIIKTSTSHEILIVQIAGLIARRIVCDAHQNQKVQAGETFGIIRFGSRVDIYLPEGVAPQVVEGQYMIGGETILADLLSSSPQRLGETRP